MQNDKEEYELLVPLKYTVKCRNEMEARQVLLQKLGYIRDQAAFDMFETWDDKSEIHKKEETE